MLHQDVRTACFVDGSEDFLICLELEFCEAGLPVLRFLDLCL